MEKGLSELCGNWVLTFRVLGENSITDEATALNKIYDYHQSLKPLQMYGTFSYILSLYERNVT